MLILAVLATIVLALLKLAGVLAVGWFVVFIPVLAFVVLWLVIVLAVSGFAGLAIALSRR